MYWIVDMKTGRKLEGCISYESALSLQNRYWAENHKDTAIIKEE